MKVSRCSFDKMTCGHDAGNTERQGERQAVQSSPWQGKKKVSADK